MVMTMVMVMMMMLTLMVMMVMITMVMMVMDRYPQKVDHVAEQIKEDTSTLGTLMNTVRKKIQQNS